MSNVRLCVKDFLTQQYPVIPVYKRLAMFAAMAEHVLQREATLIRETTLIHLYVNTNGLYSISI